MYRGVLHIQMGNRDLALKDHEILLALKPALAEELETVITEGREKQPEQFMAFQRKSANKMINFLDIKMVVRQHLYKFKAVIIN